MAPGAHPVPELTHCMAGKGVYPATQVERFKPVLPRTVEKTVPVPTCMFAGEKAPAGEEMQAVSEQCPREQCPQEGSEDTHPASSPTLG